MIYNDLNMTKNRIKTNSRAAIEYRFFVDFEGNLADAAVRKCDSWHQKKKLHDLKILGNY